MIVVSPHLDDAVFSCGEHLEPGATVITVMAGIPERREPTHWDELAGFGSPKAHVEARWREDIQSLDALGLGMPTHLDFLDSQYAPPASQHDISAALRRLLPDGAVVMVPLGLRHPDHETVGRACRLLDRRELIGYGELPYMALWPDLVGPALDWWASWGYTATPLHLPEQHTPERKLAAVRRYASQSHGLDERAVCSIERFWTLRRDGA